MRANSEEKFQKRRLLTSYFSVVVSITFVLFLVGLLGILLINSKKVADHFKEQIALTLFIKDDARPIDVTQLQKSLQLEKATRQVIFVSKEEAAAQHAQEIGEDFMEYLGYNPLLASIDVYFNAQYVTPDFIADLSTTYAAYNYVDEVYYDQPLLELLSKNIQKISYWLLAAGLGVVLWKMQAFFPELELLTNPLAPALVFVLVLVLGISISFLSTFFATQRYLNLNTEAIY